MALPRVYLIDSSIYIFRAWHVYDESITDSDNKPCNAVFGFGEFLYQLIQQKKPQRIACAFDHSQTDSYRRELFPEYKANRDPAPEALKYQFETCRDFCSALGIARYGSNRYEADDIVGTLARHYREQGYAITVVSADKDLTQLIIGEEDAWWDFARSTVLNHRGVEKHFGVKPNQIADMLALSGDKVDNISGIPGVGYATAAKVLQKYPSIESVLANSDKISEMKFRGASRTQALLNAHKECLPLNKQLTTIVDNIELEGEIDIEWKGLDHAAFSAISQKLSISEAMQQRWHNLEKRIQ